MQYQSSILIGSFKILYLSTEVIHANTTIHQQRLSESTIGAARILSRGALF